MARLTSRNPLTERGAMNLSLTDLYMRLKSYEDLEEEGRLLVLPCKVGDTLYEIDLPEYEELWNSAERPGYSGTAIFTKIKPISVKNTLPTDKDFADQFGDPLTEGRVLTAEFEDFYLVNVYTPNSKHTLERLKLRENLGCVRSF